jgi:hypothetical protein
MSRVGVAVELRKARRYRIFATDAFFWGWLHGSLTEGRGSVRDISDRGVFVFTEGAPPLDARLEIDVYLPCLEPDRSPVHLHGEGTVIRVGRSAEGRNGFAATVAFRTEGASGPTIVSPKSVQ